MSIVELTGNNAARSEELSSKEPTVAFRASPKAEERNESLSSLLTAMNHVIDRPPGSSSIADPNDLTSVAQRFEAAVWSKYGLTGCIVPDELLKECQRRLGCTIAGSTDEEEALEELVHLGYLHLYRKRREIDWFPAQYSPRLWQNVTPAPPSERPQALESNVWALLIGNDTYPAHPLGGCVNDVKLVENYLIDYLNVPRGHIRSLFNATRDIMINALYDLRDDPRVAYGDNIVIHYSGHGSSFDCASYFTTIAGGVESMEAICPIDRGQEVPDICERELNSVLCQLRDAKGPNITVIMDCSYSGGRLRSNKIGTVRYAPPEMSDHIAFPLMLEAADNHPRRNLETPSVAGDHWEPDLTAFVALSACQDFQHAEEATLGNETWHDFPDVAQYHASYHTPRFGRFTWALVKVLTSKEGNGATYDEVIRLIGRLGSCQVPVVFGSRKDSPVWSQSQ